MLQQLHSGISTRLPCICISRITFSEDVESFDYKKLGSVFVKLGTSLVFPVVSLLRSHSNLPMWRKQIRYYLKSTTRLEDTDNSRGICVWQRREMEPRDVVISNPIDRLYCPRTTVCRRGHIKIAIWPIASEIAIPPFLLPALSKSSSLFGAIGMAVPYEPPA